MTEENQLPQPTSNSLRQYIIFMIGQFISILGSSVVQFVIIWWITLTYRSPVYLSIAAFVGFGPMLLVSLFAGVYVDRWDRKKLIAIVDSMEALASLMLIYLFWANIINIYYIFTLLAVRAVFQGFHLPAIQAIIPLMIPKDKLTKINSIEYLSQGIVQLIGPILAAFLLGIYGLKNVHYIIAIDAITFVIAVIPLIFIHIPSVIKEDKSGEISKSSFKIEFKEGYVFIKETRGLLGLLSAFTTSNFFSIPIFILLPLIIVNYLNGGENEFAYSMAILQGGAIMASILMTIKNPFRKNTSGVFFGLMLGNTGAFIAILGAVWSNIWIFFIGMILMGATPPVANICSQNIWQSVVPAEKMGRVFSVRLTIAQTSAPLAMILTGFAAAIYGITPVIIFTVVTQYIILIYIRYFTNFTAVESNFKTETTIINDRLEEVHTEGVMN